MVQRAEAEWAIAEHNHAWAFAIEDGVFEDCEVTMKVTRKKAKR